MVRLMKWLQARWRAQDTMLVFTIVFGGEALYFVREGDAVLASLTFLGMVGCGTFTILLSP